jgi:hypothetical protein
MLFPVLARAANNAYHLCPSRQRMGYRYMVTVIRCAGSQLSGAKRVPKCKVVENIFIFNFAFYALSLKHFSEEI